MKLRVLTCVLLAVLASILCINAMELRKLRKLSSDGHARTGAALLQVIHKLDECPIESLLNMHRHRGRRAPGPNRRSVRAITLANGSVITPTPNPAVADISAKVTDPNHWTCVFHDVGVAVRRNLVTTNSSGGLTGWVEEDVTFYPYASIQSIEFEALE